MNQLTYFSYLLQERHSDLKSQHQHQRQIWLATSVYIAKVYNWSNTYTFSLKASFTADTGQVNGLFHETKREGRRHMGSLPMLNSLKQFQVQAQFCYRDFEVMIATYLKKQKVYTATVSWTSVSYACFLMLCHHSE